MDCVLEEVDVAVDAKFLDIVRLLLEHLFAKTLVPPANRAAAKAPLPSVLLHEGSSFTTCA